MYASKTGNAQAISERIHEEAGKQGFKSTLAEMNKFKKLPQKLEETKLVVCVCSTTGANPSDNRDHVVNTKTDL